MSVTKEAMDTNYRELLKLDISLYAILRRVLGILNLQVVDHGERVSYLYLKLAQYRQQAYDEHLRDMMLACFTHDIGAYKTEKFLDLLKFDVRNTDEHCVYGYLFMKHFSPLDEKAEVLLYHHTDYRDKQNYNSPYLDDGVLIHLLDRIDILNLKIKDDEDLYRQLKYSAGFNFDPVDVEDFMKANEKYHLLECLKDGTYKVDVKNYFNREEICNALLRPVVNMLAYEVDFRSEQTVVHSITTRLLARTLAERFGLSPVETLELECASGLHDLGKLKIPPSIVEKKGKLTAQEYHIMKKHVVYTTLILGDIFPENVVRIAYHHHERLDGSGYPNHLTAKDLSLQDRILQISDVTSALMQKRSYKEALESGIVIRILKEEAEAGRLDAKIIKELVDNYDEIMRKVWMRDNETIKRYENMRHDYNQYLEQHTTRENESMQEFMLMPSNNNFNILSDL